MGDWLLFEATSNRRQNWMEFSNWVSFHTCAVLVETSCWAWLWGLSILMSLWLGGPLHLSLSVCFLIVSHTKWTKLPYVVMDLYSTCALVVSKIEAYSWDLINIYDRFWVLVSVGSQIVAHTQMKTGDGPNKPNTMNL